MGMCYSASSRCNKIPEIINLKEEKFYFGSEFQSFQSFGPIALGPVAWQYLTVEAPSRGNLFNLWQPESKERVRKGPGSQYLLLGNTYTDLTPSHWAPPLKGPTSPNSTTGGIPKLQHMSLWDPFKAKSD